LILFRKLDFTRKFLARVDLHGRRDRRENQTGGRWLPSPQYRFPLSVRPASLGSFLTTPFHHSTQPCTDIFGALLLRMPPNPGQIIAISLVPLALHLRRSIYQ
jgi:hypothetical protein